MLPEIKGIDLARKFDQMVLGKPEAEANKIYGNELNRLANEDIYASFQAFVKIKASNQRLEPIGKFLDERNYKAIDTLAKHFAANNKNKRANLPEIPYPNDVPLPGTSWNNFEANNSNQNGANTSAKSNKLAEVLVKQGISYRENCEYQKAVDVFTKALNLDPNNGDYYLERAEANIYLRVIDAARDHQKAEELWKLEPKPNFNASTEQEKFKQQFDYNTKTKLRRTRSSEIRLQLSTLIRANKTFKESTCKSQNSNVDQNAENNANSFGLFSSESLGFPKIPSSTFQPKTANEWVEFGIKQHKEKQLLESIKSYTKAIELDSKLARAYNNRGISYVDVGNFQQAINDYTKAIELDPNLVQAYNNRGILYGRQNNADSAIADFSQAINLQPNTGVFYRLRSISYCYKGLKNLARNDEKQAIKFGEKIDKPCK